MDPNHPSAEAAISGLLDVANDAVENLRQAAELARNPSLRSAFAEQAKDGEKLAGEIRAGLKAEHVDGHDNGTVVGALQRALAKGRNRLSGDSDRGLVEEAARGAAMAEHRTAAIAEDPNTPGEARDLAAKAIATLRAQREALDKLRDAYDPDRPTENTARDEGT